MAVEFHQLDIEAKLREHCVLVDPSDERFLLVIAQHFGLIALEQSVGQDE